MFERDEQIYRDRDALREHYQPSGLVGRQQELNQYHAALQPIINDGQPTNVLLYGKTGVGKTAATRYLLKHAQSNLFDSKNNITAKLVNCDGVPTSYQLAIRLINEFRAESNHISTIGHPESEIYLRLWNELTEVEGSVLLVLDEIDHLDDDTLLSQFTKQQAHGKLSEKAIGIVGITNDVSTDNSPASSYKPSIYGEKVHFPAYRPGELAEILVHRADVAFYEGIVCQEVIERCAAFGARDEGDARRALDLLMKAGDIARERETQRVTSDQVIAAEQSLERGRISEGIAGLTQHGKIVLYALLTLDLERDEPSSCGRVFPRYRDFTDRAGIPSLTPQGMCNHLDELSALGLVSATTHPRTDEIQSSRVYQTDIHYEVAITALESTVSDVGIHQSLEAISDEPAFLFTHS